MANCKKCDTRMAKIGGPSNKKLYKCHQCGGRFVQDTSSTDTNLAAIDDAMWKRILGKGNS